MNTIGFDTSNYTTSIAYFDGTEGMNVSSLLPVKEGQLGLRQSDAVFAHIKSLPELSGRLFSHIDSASIAAVAASTRPRAVEGSYMPCFMVGYTHAKLLADALHVPLLEVSHQQGHVAACLWSAGRLDLMDQPHLAWHLSGGTTELLLVEPEKGNVRCTVVGGTSDISAGQVIDRTGKLLNLPFPSGKHLDALASGAENSDYFRVKCNDLTFSFSGLENKVAQYSSEHCAEDTAAYALNSICYTIKRISENAQAKYPGLQIVFSGGVSSNSLLRKVMEPLSPVFGQPQFSTDNAMGVSILARRMLEA